MFSIVVGLGAKMPFHSSVNFASWILFMFEHALRQLVAIYQVEPTKNELTYLPILLHHLSSLRLMYCTLFFQLQEIRTNQAMVLDLCLHINLKTIVIFQLIFMSSDDCPELMKLSHLSSDMFANCVNKPFYNRFILGFCCQHSRS